jgi:hypothetical protein
VTAWVRSFAASVLRTFFLCILTVSSALDK